MNMIATNSNPAKLRGEMTYTDVIISRWRLAALFTDFGAADRVAQSLAHGGLGLETVHDLQQLTLEQIRAAMNKISILREDQIAFHNQWRNSHVFPRGISDAEHFRI